MSKFKYALITGGAVDSVTAFNPTSGLESATQFHPNFLAIVAGLEAGDPNVWSLFDVKGAVLNRFFQISDRYTWDGSEICFDGDPVHSTFTELLGRALQDGDERNYTAIAKFGEKLATNPNLHSREQAYDWLACHKFQITDDGDVVGFKGVQNARDGEGYVSGRASQVAGKPSAFVNGLAVEPLSVVPQNIGDVVSMPRSEVSHNPAVTCSRGLHVSTRTYAESWGRGGAVLEVHVNPRDIVSVPGDANGAKVRVCKYTVSRVAIQQGDDASAPVLRQGENDYTWAGDVGYRV